MSFLRSQIREQKLLEMEVELDAFIEENNISEEAMIFKMVFDKEVFQEEKEVREYLRDKCFYEAVITETESTYDVQLLSPSQIDEDTEIQVQLRRGVNAFAADMLPLMSFDNVEFNEKGEVNLSSKFETINLHEGLPHIIEIARVAEGEHPSYGKLKITQDHLESFVSNFKSKVTGVDLAVNEDHSKRDAFGWMKDVFLSFDKQTLYAQVNWNSKGTTALSEKEYRYFSPEFRFNYTHPHTGKAHGATLLGGALTNYPFLKMEAITELNNKSQGVNKVSTEKTIELSVHNETVVELNAKITETQGKLDVSVQKNIELSDKVKELENTIELNSKKEAHQKLFTEGKINAAQLEAMNAGKGMLEVIALSEKMNSEGKGTSNVNSDDEIKLSAKELKIAESLGLTAEEYTLANK